MNTIDLLGCSPEPLMSYLKALGVFRLVAEQSDQTATLCWESGVCRLGTTLDRDGLIDFFLNQYQPTPILAPWNGGSGFYGGGAEPLEAIARSSSGRLARYREAIATIQEFVPRTKPKDEDKGNLLRRCRASLADEVVPWLDACFVLGEEGQNFFPLLGTGGNDGRLEFTNNFMQRLADVVSFDASTPPSESSRWLVGALESGGTVPLLRSKIGQFDPGSNGGPNGVQGAFEAESRVNPWDFVFMIEGALLLAGAACRRLGLQSGVKASYPFCVETVDVGSASETGAETTRAEIWLPLWDQPTMVGELQYLFAEGRAELGRRQARNTLDFALATNLLGVARGINSFVRYAFVERNGLSYIAAPLNRIRVTRRPAASLLADPALTSWLERFRSVCRDSEKTPARYRTAARQVDRAIFAFTTSPEGDAGSGVARLVAVLRALGRAERSIADGVAFREKHNLRPLQDLTSDWLTSDRFELGGPEFRLAAALAGIPAVGAVGSFRTFLESVEIRKGPCTWSEEKNKATVWSNRTVVGNLAAVFRRRLLEAYRDNQEGIPLNSSQPARLADVIAFLHGESNDDKLADLIWGLSAVRSSKEPHRTSMNREMVAPFEFVLPRLLTQSWTIHANDDGRWQLFSTPEKDAVSDPNIFHALASGRPKAVSECVDLAARRLKSLGRPVIGHRNRRTSGQSLEIGSSIPPERLLAALLFPLHVRTLDAMANAVLYPPKPEGASL